MSTNFNFDKLNFDAESTSRYLIPEIESQPVLIVKHAGESNKPFFNSLLKRQKKNRKMKTINVELLQRGRSEDREDYPKFIIKGWEKVINTQEQPVEFSEDNCREFINALPDWMFDELRGYCMDPTNFTTLEDDLEDTVKN